MRIWVPELREDLEVNAGAQKNDGGAKSGVGEPEVDRQIEVWFHHEPRALHSLDRA